MTAPDKPDAPDESKAKLDVRPGPGAAVTEAALNGIERRGIVAAGRVGGFWVVDDAPEVAPTDALLKQLALEDAPWLLKKIRALLAENAKLRKAVEAAASYYSADVRMEDGCVRSIREAEGAFKNLGTALTAAGYDLRGKEAT